MSVTIQSVSQTQSSVNAYYKVCEQGLGHFTMHLFRNEQHFRDWYQSGREGIRYHNMIPLIRAHGRRKGIIDHTLESIGNLEALRGE